MPVKIVDDDQKPREMQEWFRHQLGRADIESLSCRNTHCMPATDFLAGQTLLAASLDAVNSVSLVLAQV